MSLDLDGVCAQQINLYDELGIRIDDSPQQVPLGVIKKQYRKLALLYHPDKQPDSLNAIHKFHMLSLAANILTDESSRATYDLWLGRRLGDLGRNDQQRNELIDKLEKRESMAQKKDKRDFTHDLAHIQDYGATLRKMKHFKIPYGDWKTLELNQTSQKPSASSQKLRDCSTLRVEIQNSNRDDDLANKGVLMALLQRLFQVKVLHDLRYSSRNTYTNGESIVAYAVFGTPTESKRVFERWTADPGLSCWGPILEVSPWIPVEYYKSFTKKVELDPEITELINNDTVVID